MNQVGSSLVFLSHKNRLRASIKHRRLPRHDMNLSSIANVLKRQTNVKKERMKLLVLAN